MEEIIEIAIDFMDMTDDGRVWARSEDALPGVPLAVGRYVVIGDDGADPRVAQIVAIEPEGAIELEVLPGDFEAHAALLSTA